MAQITNVKGLPQPVVDAIKYDTYKVGGDISVTTLIDAPQIRILKRAHRHQITEDVSEMLWALMGTCVHMVLERAHINDLRKRAFMTVLETIKENSVQYSEKDQEALQELQNKIIKLMVQFFPEVESRYIWESTLTFQYRGKILYGTFDLYDKIEKCLYDYKVCSVYAYAYPESRKKWSAQTNVYAFMLRESGIEVNEIRIVAIFRDWSASKMEISKGDYPESQLLTLNIPVVPQEKMLGYIKNRMDLHIEAENGNVPDCSGVERWASATEYVVKVTNRKKALRKLDSEAMAKEWVAANKHKFELPLTIFERPGESKRCESYCVVREFCEQRKCNNSEEE